MRGLRNVATRRIGSQRDRLTAEQSPQSFAAGDRVAFEHFLKVQGALHHQRGVGEHERLGWDCLQAFDRGLVSGCLSLQVFQ